MEASQIQRVLCHPFFPHKLRIPAKISTVKYTMKWLDRKIIATGNYGISDLGTSFVVLKEVWDLKKI